MTDIKQKTSTEPQIVSQLSAKYEISEILDTSGTRCPIPLLRAKKALKSLNDQAFLLVIATDPSAKGDFDAMLKHLPHNLIDYQSEPEPSRIDYFIIQKGVAIN